jgi:hypothetical protein
MLTAPLVPLLAGFCESSSSQGGASADGSVGLTRDYKNLGDFTNFAAGEVLVVAHSEGTALGWRQWTTQGCVPLRSYFVEGVNTCPSSGSGVGAGRNILGYRTVAFDNGSLVQKEPLVRNFGDANMLYTNSGGANDIYMNRMTTDSDNSDRNNGW